MSDYRKMAREARERNKGVSRDVKSTGLVLSTYFSAPDEIPVWFAKADEKGKEYYIDILQFPFGPNFPNDLWSPPYREGDFCRTLIVEIHKNVGPEGSWIICPRIFKERCPICEERDALQKPIYKDDTLTKEEQKAKAKKIWEERRTYRRQLLFIVVRDGADEEDKGVQVWDVPTAYMEDKLDVIAKQSRTGDVIDYYDWDEGKTVRFTVRQKGDYAEFIGHQFEDRIDPNTRKRYVIEDEFVDMVCKYPLDTMIKRLSYEEVCAMYFAKPASGIVSATEEDAPVSSRRRKAAAEPPPEEKNEDDHVEEPPVGRRGRRRTEETPPEDTGPACPHGGIFGEDCLKLTPQCDECDQELYLLCEEKHAEIEKKKEESAGRRRRRSA